MEDLFRQFWWLIFPIMGFAFAGAGMVMSAAMQRDRMKVLRAYAEKGQTPPPEVAGAMDDAYDYGYGPGYGYGYDRRADRYARRAWRREMRWRAWGPWWGVRRSFFFFAVFLGLALSAGWNGGHAGGFFLFFAVISGAFFLSSLFSLPFLFGRRDDRPQGGATGGGDMVSGK